MSITNCYRSRLPFRTKDAEWENYCLSFKEGDYLRVILTEKITTHTNNNNTNNVPPCHWCIAQDEEGGVGLAPLYALYKTQETSEKMASTVTSLWDTLLADYVPKTQQRAGTNIVKKGSDENCEPRRTTGEARDMRV
ncbi:hypothetical protein AGDE_16507 [Angomonas deanei]|nr:hypothetical protein AGDE_16507 [Angomonas deanei]|eukprot:EPY16983.1 hypothetical protein AGDE_16507 [Angomonas deanei]